ncbi:FecR domain-containing protein [Sphingomonas sp. CFBP 13728]|uniref:FecR family protein n=1 Tax=Sphingomonas sp. CFBP 13728 TaxID=2775294 RepID=UPI00177B846B|nr:FecR domain-containing protein [Sphingomonas sp. CFBP 13728]MBD8620906.1 FecR domain-containing protein [Sphingomonas sp. CFBP 13728]
MNDTTAQSKRSEIDVEAARLVASLSSTPDPARERIAMDWAGQSPLHAIALARAESAWETAGRLRAAAPQGDTARENSHPTGHWIARPTHRRTLLAGLLAASAVGGIATTLALGSRDERYTADIGTRRSVSLTDGSRIDLNTGSVIAVAFEASRRVVRLLQGEAMFDVAHDAERPFYVQVGGSLLRVLGTAFNVRIRAELVELTVSRGAVGVSDGAKMLRTVAAGYGAAIRGGVAETNHLGDAVVRQRTAWQEGVIELDGDTLEQAVAEFNRYRHAPIVLGDNRLAALRIGGRFGTSDSAQFIAAVQQILPVRMVANVDGSILLTPLPTQ